MHQTSLDESHTSINRLDLAVRRIAYTQSGWFPELTLVQPLFPSGSQELVTPTVCGVSLSCSSSYATVCDTKMQHLLAAANYRS